MAISTGAADVGVLSLDTGSRPRGGNSGDGDGFADALDTQMQKPRPERPRAEARPKSEPRPKDSGTDARNEQPPAAREGRPTDESAADKGTDDGAKKDDESTPVQSLVAMLLQTVPDPGTGRQAAGVSTDTGNASGKELPLPAATDAAQRLSAPIATQLQPAAVTESTAAAMPLAGLVATAPAVPGLDPRAGTPSDPTAAQTPAPELPEIPDAASDAKLGQAMEARAAKPAPAAGAEALSQAQLAPGNEAPAAKVDGFAATLAALRDLAPRATGDTSTAAANGPAVLLSPSTPATATTQAAPAASTVNVPVGQQGWDQAVSERVLWMTRHGVQEAKIELNPRDLGPLEVRVSVQQDQASVAFTAHTPAARDALEAAMPRLREMLADSGLNLAQSDVSHRSFQQHQESAWGGNGSQQAAGGLSGAESEEHAAHSVETPLPSLGAVDYYA